MLFKRKSKVFIIIIIIIDAHKVKHALSEATFHNSKPIIGLLPLFWIMDCRRVNLKVIFIITV